MTPITSSDLLGTTTVGSLALDNLTLSANAIAEKLNDVAGYVDSSFAQLSDPGIEQLKVTKTLQLSGGAEFRMYDSDDRVKNFNMLGGYAEGSVGKYTIEKNKTGNDDYVLDSSNWKVDPSYKTAYYFEPMCVGAKCYCILSAWNNEDGDGMLKLSGDISGIDQLLKKSASKDARWSLNLYNSNTPGMYRIKSLSGEYVVLDKNINLQDAGIIDVNGNLINGFDKGEERYLEIWENGLIDEDDNSFYCATWPEAGN